jgi:hypothetical protein
MQKSAFVLCFTSLLALAAVPAHAGEWFTDEASGCQAWNNFPQSDEKIVWSGACKDGKAFGPGTLKFVQKDPQKSTTLNCSFLDGKCQGAGTTTWANGNRREGNEVNGFTEGKGVFIWVNGDRYEGDFVQGKRTGKGTLVWANGNRYTGDFVDGVRTGKGIFGWTDGSHYEGDFVQNKRTGKGTFVWANGDRYEGDFVESCIQVAPEYPLSAEHIRFTGQVMAAGRVVDGAVRSVRILSGPNVFHDAVRDALMQYKCPGVVGPVEFKQEFNFK